MNIHSPRQILRKVFDYESFFGKHQAIVEHVAAGGGALVLITAGADYLLRHFGDSVKLLSCEINRWG